MTNYIKTRCKICGAPLEGRRRVVCSDRCARNKQIARNKRTNEYKLSGAFAKKSADMRRRLRNYFTRRQPDTNPWIIRSRVAIMNFTEMQDALDTFGINRRDRNV